MSEEQQVGQLYLHLDMGDVLDADQLDQLTRQLRSEMLDQDVEDVELVRGDELPEGTKAAEAITWGALAIQVLPSFMPKVVEFLQSWTMRAENRKVKVRSQIGDQSIELEYSPSGVSSEDMERLILALQGGKQEGTVEEEQAQEGEGGEDEAEES
jgi:hypothetical protein